jgi:hypothetical protein
MERMVETYVPACYEAKCDGTLPLVPLGGTITLPIAYSLPSGTSGSVPSQFAA